MKTRNIKPKKNFLKKLIVKINRLAGYEIIDQSNYFVETLDKKADKNLSSLGNNSITMPLGKLEIKRKVKSLDIIIRSCASVKMLSQSKERIFAKEKFEYSIRTLNSIVNSINYCKDIFTNINLKITIIDHNSSNEVKKKYENILKNSSINFEIVDLNFENYKKYINKINQENKEVTENQKSNMSNIHQSLDFAKNFDDLIYFVEDDYIHRKTCIEEMIYAYEKFSTVLDQELFLCPTDYPYLYSTPKNTNLLIGNKYHWRTINETLCTFLTSKQMILKYYDLLTSMCKYEHLPFEKPLHDIFEKEFCLSPVPSLALHCTNVNSAYGLSPNVNIEKLWKENKYE